MKKNLKDNLNWFRRSGVMLPADGTWGVAERIAVTAGNAAIETMRDSFPAVTEHSSWCVLEQRRADCNFQTAMLFLRASEIFSSGHYRETGENILYYLYCRSGLLEKTGLPEFHLPRGSWQWSHIVHYDKIYFDDESWCLFFQLELAEKYPDIAGQFQCRYWAEVLAGELAAAAARVLKERKKSPGGFWEDTGGWRGNLDLPHWGALVCLALARAAAAVKNREVRQQCRGVIRDYLEYIEPEVDKLICSETAYLLLGTAAVCTYCPSPLAGRLLTRAGNRLIAAMDERGNLPAQHREAPAGSQLADLIYTDNWALPALQAGLRFHPEWRPAFQKLLTLVLSIQDRSPEVHFQGCWRGMFDLAAGTWGGGDLYEGGANSIYTGWTNAPIALTIAAELRGESWFQ